MTTLTPAYPKQFTFYHPIAVRYADLDTHRMSTTSLSLSTSRPPAPPIIRLLAFGTALPLRIWAWWSRR
jgi:hypothetical protein